LVLAIMKDSRVGAYGAIGLAMMLGLKWATLASLPHAAFPVLFIGAQVMSRWCATALIWRLSYVRTDADAKSRAFVDGFGAADWILSGALGVLALLPLMALDPPTSLPWGRLLMTAPAAAAAAALLAGAYFKTRIGGYTGDCLGATQQIAELCFLLAALGATSAPMMGMR
jgi:adenosylcobinamide-GDP ribazoletransferase